jgi:hypothetical protein
MTSHILARGSEAVASLASQVIEYTGGDTRLGRRVRLGATVTLVALVLRTVVVGPPCSKKKRRGKRGGAIQEDLRNVGKGVGGGDASDEGADDFDEYDVVIVGGGMCAASQPLPTRNLDFPIMHDSALILVGEGPRRDLRI